MVKLKQRLLIFPVLALMLALFSNAEQKTTYRTKKGKVIFQSAAPHEIIQASSDNLMGLLNPQKKTFRFGISMNSFMGFNSPKQQEHFNENYIESDQFPKAVFVGKIVENIDVSVPGTYKIRAKGKLLLHGVQVPKTIKCKMIVQPQFITIKSKFGLTLNEFGMRVPGVIKNKLAEDITVNVNVKMKAE